jgi:hydroxylamine dehydrogenase
LLSPRFPLKARPVWTATAEAHQASWSNGGESAHAKKNVDCYSCHRANEKDPATFEHYGHRIAVIVTPSYCGPCHGKEIEQFEKSHHAQAAQFIGSLDNMLGEVVEGGPAAANGCRQCHGSEVRHVKDGKFDADT